MWLPGKLLFERIRLLNNSFAVLFHGLNPPVPQLEGLSRAILCSCLVPALAVARSTPVQQRDETASLGGRGISPRCCCSRYSPRQPCLSEHPAALEMSRAACLQRHRSLQPSGHLFSRRPRLNPEPVLGKCNKHFY